MAKSRRKRQRRRDPGHRAPARGAHRSGGVAEVDQVEREIDAALSRARQRATEALAPGTAPERVAAIMAEDFEQTPAPPGFTARMLQHGGPDRARAVLSELERLAPQTVLALTFAAEVASLVDGDEEAAAGLLELALDAYEGIDSAGSMAMHLLHAGMLVEAHELAEEKLFEDPEDELAQKAYARALQGLHARAGSGAGLSDAEREALARFEDRSMLYRLREELTRAIDADPELPLVVATTVKEWFEELADGDEDPLALLQSEDDHSPLAGKRDGLFRLAVERAWLRGPNLEDGDLDEIEDEDENGYDRGCALALLATGHETPLELADAARMWLRTCTYGLWRIDDPAPDPGVWLTDIATGTRRYAAIPPEQLEQASRWSVLLCTLVAIDGTWRTTGAVIPLRPAEADLAAAFLEEATDDLMRAMSGKRPRRHAGRRGKPQPHGVLVDVTEEASPVIADLVSKVLSNLLPSIAAGIWRRREAGPKLSNTEGHPLKFITAQLQLGAGTPADAQRRLAAHPDFRTDTDEDGTELLTWWGRELTQLEAESAKAKFREQFGADAVPDDPDEIPRWLRGRLRAADRGFEVEVNSEQRLELLLELLAELGLEPAVTRRTATDPTQDLPPIQLSGPLSFGGSQADVDIWLEHWPSERVPALGQLTPRVAARRKDRRPVLEALLREFEHDAHQLARAGGPAPDIDRLRSELGMEVWWESPHTRS